MQFKSTPRNLQTSFHFKIPESQTSSTEKKNATGQFQSTEIGTELKLS